MLKRELKINLKSLCIWTTITMFLFLIIFCIYPSIMSSTDSQQMDEILKMFPPELLKLMNMDIVGIESVFGWIQTEGYMFLSLIGSIYVGMLGSSILLKEENDKTIEFLYAKPVSRRKIVSAKIICGVINIFVFLTAITIFLLIGLIISNDLNLSLLLNLCGSLFFVYYTIFFGILFVSTFFKKTKKTLTICFGAIFISYFLQIVGTMAENIKFIKYFSVFELAPARTIINEGHIPLLSALIGITLIIVLTIGTYVRYQKKELVI